LTLNNKKFQKFQDYQHLEEVLRKLCIHNFNVFIFESDRKKNLRKGYPLFLG